MVYERAELYGLDISTKEGQDAVQDEIANNAVGLYFSHPGTVDKMVRKDVSFVVKMKDYFKAFLQKLKDFFTNPPVRMKYDEVEVVKSQAAELEKILSVTEDAIERYRAELAEKRTADSASKKADGKNADADNANKKADNTAGNDADADSASKKADNTAGKDAEENAYALSPEARSEIDEYLEYAETNRDLLGEFEKALFESMRGLKAENEYVDAKNRELRRKFADPMHYKHVYDEIMKADLTKELSEADIKRALYRLGKDYYGKALPDTIKKSITDFYYLLANSTPDTITALDVRKKAVAIAYDIVRNAAFADDTLRNDRAAVREVLQGQHIYVSQRDVSEGAALSDLTAWYNYKDGHYSVRSAIEDYMGKAATQYIEQFFADLNGSAGKVEGFGLWEKAFRNVKAASVLANVRVFVQQHTSLVRAHLSDLDWRYIVKGEEQMIAGNTVLIRGGHAAHGASAGAFYGGWGNAASRSGWSCAARPRLKNP